MMQLHQMIAVALVTVALGCSGERSDGCREDRECAAGVCVNGSCRALASQDLGGVVEGDHDLAGVVFDLSRSTVGDAAGGDALAPTCNLNNDGVIARSEAPFMVGLGGLFAVNPSGTTTAVNLTPQNGTWDFSAPVANETKVFDQLLSPSGRWWSNDFPSATHAQRLSDGDPLLGVYRATVTSLDLLGMVSEQSGLQQTRLTYATPIPLLKFPLALNDQWTAESDLTGTLNGFLFAGRDRYDVAVERRGTTKVAAGSFDTLRVRTRLAQTVGLSTVSRILYLHMTECYGAVARIRSRDNESSDDFTQATEYRRLATP